MKLSLTLKDLQYNFDLEKPLDISIPMRFDSSHPVCWSVSQANATTFVTDCFIGDTRQGGSCNVREYRLIPQCQGTHTECVGHISHQAIYLNSIFKNTLIPTTLITVKPESALDTSDSYHPEKSDRDFLITKKLLVERLQSIEADLLTGLIIRTLPNCETKKQRNYLQESFPFFSLEAMKYLMTLKIEHLLVDMPSVDRKYDRGYLSIHRLFWHVPLHQHYIEPATASRKTISEMIYVPDWIKDGFYLLNLQIPPLMTDAAPSRPLLYQLLP